MSVKNIYGLLTLIKRNEEQCLQNYQLHNTSLVIDADSLANRLMYNIAADSFCFGGDFDMIAANVANFFKLLYSCNVTPYLVFFGGRKKHSEVECVNRLEAGLVKTKVTLDSVFLRSDSLFPYTFKETFEDVVKNLQLKFNIKIVRLDYVDHVELTTIARILNCPVLSWSLEYYLFDVPHIPYDLMEMSEVAKTQIYVPCKLFVPNDFLKSICNLDKRLLPILAMLLGTDPIDQVDFKSLFSKLRTRPRKGTLDQLIDWLVNHYRKHDSILVMLMKVLDDLYENNPEREELYEKIISIIEGHNNNYSEYLQMILGISFFVESNLFKYKYRRCEYPQCFMDIVTHNKYMLEPLIEDLNLEHAHSVSLELIAILHKLLKNSPENLTVYARIGDQIYQQTLPDITLNLPQNLTLSDIQLLSSTEKRQTFLHILNIEDAYILHALKPVSTSWRLLIITFKYLKDKFYISWPVVYSIILCKIIIMYVDTKIGMIRSLYALQNAIHQISRKCDTIQDNKHSTVNISIEDCISASEALIPYFEIRDEMRMQPELFNRSLMHLISEVQSCIVHMNYLNCLLNSPFQKNLLSECFNGTFIYNLSSDMLEKVYDSTLDETICYAFVEDLLIGAEGVLKFFYIITDILKLIL